MNSLRATPPGVLARMSPLSVLLIVSGTLAHAATIGVNFAAAGFGFDLAPSTNAGVVLQDNWNNIGAITNPPTTLNSTFMNDDSGTPTSMTFSVVGTSLGLGSVQNSAFTTPGDERLMASNLSSNTPMTVSLTGIPYAAYDLIIYNLPLFNGVKYTYTVGSTSYFGNSPPNETDPGYVDNNIGTPFTFTQATSTNTLSPTADSTYARFDGLSGSSLTFTITGGNGIAYTNGFQIIEIVPEPSRAVLLLGGLLAVGARRRRSRW